MRFLCVALLLVLAPRAEAKATIQGAILFTGTWTDNALSTPQGTPAIWDLTTDIRPSLILAHLTPRLSQRLAGAFVANLSFHRPDGNTYSGRVDYSGLYELGPRSQLFLGASVLEGNLRTVATLGDPSTGTIDAMPVGDVYFLQPTAYERWNYELTRNWRISQTLGFVALTPIAGGQLQRNYDTDLRFIAEHEWQHDALAVEVRADVVHYDDFQPMGSAFLPAKTQLLDTAQARWRHDFNAWVTSEADLGLDLVSHPGASSNVHVEPNVVAALRYFHYAGTAELAYGHSMQPNALVAQMLILDQVLLRGALPLGQKTNLVLSAAAGWQHSHRYDIDTDVESSAVDAFLVDVALRYRLAEELALYARYQFTDQIGDNAPVGAVPSFLRNSAILGIEGIFPSKAAAPPPVPTTRRVDRADQNLVPAIPNPLRR